MLKEDQGNLAAQRRALRAEGIFLSRIQDEPTYGVVFPGHGSQYLNELAELRWIDPTISSVFDEADCLYRSRYGMSLSECIYTDLGATATTLLAPTAMQCGIFTASVALFRRLMTFAPPPGVLIGHSLGEYAAYVAGGMLSFADGLAAVMARAEEVSRLPESQRGKMLAVRIESEAEERVYRRLLLLASSSGEITESIINSNIQRIVSGSEAAIAAFEQEAGQQRLAVTRLRVTHAYHCALLRPCVAPLRSRLRELTFNAPSVTILSSITGDVVPQTERNLPDLLSAQLIQPFDFDALLRKAAKLGVEDFVEVGPNEILTGIIEKEKGDLSCVPMDSRQRTAMENEQHVRLYLTSLGVCMPADGLPSAKVSKEKILELVSAVTGYPRYVVPCDRPLNRLGLVPKIQQQLRTRLENEYGQDFGELSWTVEQLVERFNETNGHQVLQTVTSGDEGACGDNSLDEGESEVRVVPEVSDLVGGRPSSEVASSVTAVSLVGELVAEFALATGYPADVIEPELDLEADLGVDSVKRAQVIAVVAGRHGVVEGDLDLHGVVSVSLLAERLAQAAGGSGPLHAADGGDEGESEVRVVPEVSDLVGGRPSSEVASSVTAVSLVGELVAEFALATGYPADVIEPELDLEADLGVDSVKRAQVIAVVAGRHGVVEGDLDLHGVVSVSLLAERLAQATGGRPEGTKPPEPTALDPASGDETEIALRYVPRALVRDLKQSPGKPRELRGARLFLVPSANQDLTQRVRHRLEAAGADVWVSAAPVRMLDNAVDQATLAEDIAAEHKRCGPREGIVDLASYTEPRDALTLDTAKFSEAWQRSFARTFSVYQEYFADLSAAGDRALIAVLTNCGGGYGLKAATNGDALGCLSVGFVKSLAKELTNLNLCLVDVDDAPGASVADKFVAELRAGSEDDEVSYLGDLRHVIKVLPAPAGAPEHRRATKGAVVFTGGSRGIALECAIGLAQSDLVAADGKPSPIVILGRSQIDDPVSLPYLKLTDEEFGKAQSEIIGMLRRRSPSSRPIELQQQFRRIANNRQLKRSIERIKAASVPIEYRACDVTNADDVAEVMGDIHSRYGGIRGLVHAAGLESLGQLPKKQYALASSLIETKLQGFHNLLRTVDPAELDFVVAFTSISGRFGMDGQTDYTAASAAVSALCCQLSQRYPAVRMVAIDWTAWAEVGMATHQSVREVQEQQRGLRYLPPQEGCRHFLRELAGGADPQVMIFGALGTNEPRSALDCLTPDRRAIANSVICGSIVDQGHSPMLDTCVSQSAEGMIYARRLDTRLDKMMTDHLVKGSPTLPGVFHLEAMSEAARLSSGRDDLMIESAEFEHFVKCSKGRVCDLQIAVSSQGTDRFMTAISADVVSPNGIVLERARKRSQALLSPRRSVSPCPYDWDELLRDQAVRFDLDAYYADAESYIAFGPSFRKLRGAWRTSQGVMVGRFDVSADAREVLAVGGSRLATEPLLLDNVGRLALIDIFHRFGDQVIPVRLENAAINSPSPESTEVLGCLKVQPLNQGQYAFSLYVAECDGTPLIGVERIVVQKLNNQTVARNLAYATA
ncbi:MAG: SDR family NAD(P)-dependent oxidoreductase [Propionibacteriaceae bacterium]|nr:SDR family NAD(P)-dependent oxidoreductase [Propionibacteriaceae bacterium]